MPVRPTANGGWRAPCGWPPSPKQPRMLPSRDGVGPSWVGLIPGPWPRLIDFLVARFPAISGADWRLRIANGDIVDEQGRRLLAEQDYRPHGRLCYYRSLPPEPRIAEDEAVLFEDELLVVADKPHFLPVTPSGRYLQETLLVRLRRRLGIETLTPLHRIDRETAGLVLFAKQPATRGAYQTMFAQRQMRKTYHAIAQWRPLPDFPLTRASMMASSPMFMQMCEVAARGDTAAAAPNAITTIRRLQIEACWARYELQPLTGQRHQLRVHMAALGLPILGDRIYPVLQPEGNDDVGNPLRLLAQEIDFVDPVTGRRRSFASERKLNFPVGTDPEV